MSFLDSYITHAKPRFPEVWDYRYLEYQKAYKFAKKAIAIAKICLDIGLFDSIWTDIENPCKNALNSDTAALAAEQTQLPNDQATLAAAQTKLSSDTLQYNNDYNQLQSYLSEQQVLVNAVQPFLGLNLLEFQLVSKLPKIA